MALLHVWRPSVAELSAGSYANVRQQDLTAAGSSGITYKAGGGRFGENTVLDNNTSSSSYLRFEINGQERDWDQTTGIYILTSVYWEGGPSTGDIGTLLTISDVNGSVTASQAAFRLNVNLGGTLAFQNEAGAYYGVDSGVTQQQATLKHMAWNELEIYVTPSATAGTLTVKLNGVTIVNGTNIADTGVASTWESVSLWGGAIGAGTSAERGFRWGDTLIMDGSGSTFNDFIGDFRFEVDAAPTADGTTTAWTALGAGAAYVEIDDTEGTPDDDTSYIESTTAAQDSFVTYAGATLTNVNTVTGVVVGVYARDDAGSAPLQIAHRVDSSSSFGTGTTYTLLATYEVIWDEFALNPNGSVAWTKTTIDAAEWGVQSIT